MTTEAFTDSGTASPHERVDPRVVRSRAIILPVALEHFVAHGYVGAAVDDIARDAGVSKRTVYNLFGDKQGLFRAVVAVALDTAEQFSRDLLAGAAGGPESVEEQLRDVGVRLARAVLLGPVVRLRRLLVAEAHRFPDLAVEYYERAPGRVMAALGARLGELDHDGVLQVDDPDRAAEHLAFLVMGALLDRAMFDVATRPDAARLDACARDGVEAFLRAYRARQRPKPSP